MANEIATYLKFANVQMAAEAIKLDEVIANTTTLEAALIYGNNRSSKFPDTLAKDFAANWQVVAHQPNTSTGFSGTLFKYTGATDEAKGLKNGELVLSFRSTEFADDAARDNEATNALEIRPFGWAFGQIDDMQKWYAQLSADPAKLQGKPFSVTGYSLGGHLATAFNQLYPGVATSTYTFNGAGTGKLKAGNSLADVMSEFATRRGGDNIDQFTTPEGRDLYQVLSSRFFAGGVNDAASIGMRLSTVNQRIDVLKIQLDVQSSQPGTAAVIDLSIKTIADLEKLKTALGRMQGIAEEAFRTNGISSGSSTSAPSQGVTTDKIEATALDYQLAVLKAGKRTESYGDIDALRKARDAGRRITQGLANVFDIYGDTTYSMVSNSQGHLGLSTPVWIEDQPEQRGSVKLGVIEEAVKAGGVKFLVPGFSLNDFGDTHSLVLLIDSLSVQNTLAQLDARLGESANVDTMKAVLNGASNAKVETGALLSSVGPDNQGKADGDTLENVTNDLARLFGIKGNLKGDLTGGSWAKIRGASTTVNEGDITDRNDLQTQLAAINTFIKDKNLAGKFEIKPIVSVSKDADKETYKDFASIIGLVSGARFGIAAKDVASRELINQALGAIPDYSQEYAAFTQDKTVREQSNILGQLNYTDKYLNDRKDYLNSLIEANTKNADKAPDGTIKISAKAITNIDTTYIDLVNDKVVLVEHTANAALIQTKSKRIIFGDSKNNTALNGQGGEDHIYAGGGDDTVNGGAGDDYIEGNAGVDTLNGGDGKDELHGGVGDDILDGGAGDDDKLFGGAGADRILGGTGKDTLYGDFQDPDANQAASGADTLIGGEGNDTLYGGQGDDVLYGDQESAESLEAVGWNDRLVGGKGADRLYGGSGSDTLEGGDDADQLTGGWGNDILQGGEGVDTYTFNDYFGKDTITDSDGKGSLQINGQTLEGTFTSYGNAGAYRLKLADGTAAGLSVYKDSGSTTGKSAILKFSSNLANAITIRNFDEDAAKNGAQNSNAMTTINTIALGAHSIRARCSKHLKNRGRSSQKTRNCKKSKPNQPLALIKQAQSAIEFIVIDSKITGEVQHA